MIRFGVAFLGAALVSIASAGNPVCRTCAPVVTSTVAVPVAVQQQPSVFVINAPPTVPQGQSSYATGGSNVQVQLLNLDRIASQVLSMVKAAEEAQPTYRVQALSLVTELAKIQQPAVELQARGEAAQRTLQAAGLAATGTQSATRTELQSESKFSLLQQKCAECHTGQDAEAGFRMDEDFDSSKALLRVVRREMPPKPVDAGTWAGLIEELATLQIEQAVQ